MNKVRVAAVGTGHLGGYHSEKLHKIELPKNLVDQEIHSITHKLKKEERQ